MFGGNEVQLPRARMPQRTGQSLQRLKVFQENEWDKVTIVWAGSDAHMLYRFTSLPMVFVIDQQGNIAAVDHRVDIPAVVESLLRTKPR